MLPREAGLARLLDEGALVVAKSGRVIELGGLARIDGDANVDRLSGVTNSYILPRELRIVGKMRFPAGLHGAHATHFILGKGVPMPEGDPGHSQIDSEEDQGQQLRAPAPIAAGARLRRRRLLVSVLGGPARILGSRRGSALWGKADAVTSDPAGIASHRRVVRRARIVRYIPGMGRMELFVYAAVFAVIVWIVGLVPRMC